MRLYAKLAVILAITVAVQGLIGRYGWEFFFGIRCQIALLTNDELTYARLITEAEEHSRSLLVGINETERVVAGCRFVDAEATDTSASRPVVVVEALDMS
jgi:hypothetical protein